MYQKFGIKEEIIELSKKIEPKLDVVFKKANDSRVYFV